MNKNEITIVYYFILLFTMTVLSGCANVQRDWEYASRKDSIKAYEAFIKDHPESEYNNQAQEKIQKILFEGAESEYHRKKNTISLEKFIKFFPSSKYSEKARNIIIEEAEYSKAKKEDSKPLFEAYLKDYPSGEYSDEARKSIRKIDIRSQLERAQELGETALRMGYVIVFKKVGNYLLMESAVVVHPDTLKEDMKKFEEELKAGADPNLIRIIGFQRPKAGSGFLSMGNPGKVIPADEGSGITLLQYCKENDLDKAAELLKKYQGK